jgi:hypothetical protein
MFGERIDERRPPAPRAADTEYRYVMAPRQENVPSNRQTPRAIRKLDPKEAYGA